MYLLHKWEGVNVHLRGIARQRCGKAGSCIEISQQLSFETVIVAPHVLAMIIFLFYSPQPKQRTLPLQHCIKSRFTKQIDISVQAGIVGHTVMTRGKDANKRGSYCYSAYSTVGYTPVPGKAPFFDKTTIPLSRAM
jgi:hypothetical protein